MHSFSWKLSFHLKVIFKADELFINLMKEGVIVRPIALYDMPEFIRVTVGTKEENDYFLVKTWPGFMNTNIKEILVIGLGLIGSSIAKVSKEKGIKVHGFDIDDKSLQYA